MYSYLILLIGWQLFKQSTEGELDDIGTSSSAFLVGEVETTTSPPFQVRYWNFKLGFSQVEELRALGSGIQHLDLVKIEREQRIQI